MSELEDLLEQLKELLEVKRLLLASIDVNLAELASGMPAEESTDE